MPPKCDFSLRYKPLLPIVELSNKFILQNYEYKAPERLMEYAIPFEEQKLTTLSLSKLTPKLTLTQISDSYSPIKNSINDDVQFISGDNIDNIFEADLQAGLNLI